MRRRLVLLSLVTAIAAPVVAIAGTEKPEYRYHDQVTATVFIDTTSCAGFGPAELAVTGRLAWHYAHFAEPVPFGSEEGWATLKAEGTPSGHTYRVHERYDFPRDFREFVLGRADSVIERDDAATLAGASTLLLNPILSRYELLWNGQPTCSL